MTFLPPKSLNIMCLLYIYIYIYIYIYRERERERERDVTNNVNKSDCF